jgi:hypothetical protein
MRGRKARIKVKIIKADAISLLAVTLKYRPLGDSKRDFDGLFDSEERQADHQEEGDYGG